jgi:putative acetyltransferase
VHRVPGPVHGAADTLTIRREPFDSPDALELRAELQAELIAIYDGEDTESGTKPSAADTPVFVVAREGGDDGPAIGCGALRPYGDGRVEMKRMYVRPDRRGRGYSRAILAALEDEARALGATTVILETGVRQTEAVALYERSGYEPIPLFGPYVDSPISLCYEKRIAVGG